MVLPHQKKIISLIALFLVVLIIESPFFSVNVRAESPYDIESSTADPSGKASSGAKNLDVKPAGLAAQDALYNSSTIQYNSGGGPVSTGGTPSFSSSAYSSIGGTATCSAGQILGRLIGSAVGQAVSGITNRLQSTVASAVKDITKVPVIDRSNLTENQAQSQNTSSLVNKSVGGGNAGGGGILSGIAKGISSVSWDSIMYCIVNQILTYITQSTIQWINSGFKGNPVFVQNIGAMFQQIQNNEKRAFMQQLQAGFKNGQGIAINGVRNTAFQVAQPLRQGVMNTVLNYGNNNNQITPQMSPQLSQNFNSFVNGRNFRAGGGSRGLAELSYNNGYNADINTQQLLAQQIYQAQQIKQSQIVNGTQSFTTCRPGKTRADGTCAPIDQIVTTPAQAINSETSQVSGMKYLRLSFAKDFDSVITALVNQLVKIAVNKVYEAVQK